MSITILNGFDKFLENKIRLGILSVLAVNDSYDFSGLKKLLGATDGNLTTHLKALEDAGYLTSRKQFIGRRPNTSYKITESGRKSFVAHLESISGLYGMLKNQ